MNRDLLKQNFENHGFETSFFDTKEKAAQYIFENVKGKTIAFGGSVTMQEMKLPELLAQNNDVIWHWNSPGKETLMDARRAKVYMTSANGVSETGELINIDGTGNRVSATLYGPEKIYFIVGSNKLESDMHKALWRAKNIAAPKNAVRLERKTPCVTNGGDRCYDCNSPERICHATVILERPCSGTKVEIVFIEESLGY